MDPGLRVAAVVPCTEVEGPHRRCALWVRGCSLRCPGCCNPELFEPGSAAPTPVEALLDEIDEARARHGIEGITILGGEPLEQIAGVTALAAGMRARGLGVVVFSGYTLEEAMCICGFERLWPLLDTIVDGRFDRRARDLERRFVGSTNQRIHHRTDRYRDEALWRGEAGAEARITPDGSMSLHGDPRAVRELLRHITPR
jgi:anaerobic ribonucleoside-triphosphate reductase activating protein